jgi:RNA recognition motif-containing protein
MSSKLYVGNLSYSTTEDTLRDVFSGNGRTVVSVSIVTDRDTGRSKGFGFVEMGSDDEARAGMDELNGAEIDGRSIRVNEAHEKPEGRGGPRAPRGPRFGGGGGYEGGGRSGGGRGGRSSSYEGGGGGGRGGRSRY